MANKVEIIFDGINRTDRAFADLFRDVRQAQRDIAAMGANGELVTDRLSGAFEALGVRSSAAIERERQFTVRAYRQIRNSGVASAEEIARAKTAAQAKLAALGAEARNTARRVEEIGKAGRRSGAEFGRGITATLGKLLVLELAVTHIGRLLDRLVFDFNSKLETAGLGIASAYMGAGTYIDVATGKALEGSEALSAAQADARRMTEELQVANFLTIATLDQLVRAYQETLPVAMAKGFDRRQVKEFTVAMVQAAGAIGLQLDMLGEETRSILTGAINPRTSRIATVLGLRNEDIAKYKGNADELFAFLMHKLSAYRVAGIESQKTWAGVWSNSLDIFNQVAAKVSEPLFEAVKAELTDIAEKIVTIDQVSGEIKWNEDFIEGVETTKEAIAAVIAEMYRMGMLIDKIGGTMTTIGAIVTFGDWDAKFREWNKHLESRYIESDRKLQELANRLAGLNTDGTPKADGGSKAKYKVRPKTPEEEAAERDRRIKGYVKAGSQTPDDSWRQQYEDRQGVIENDYRVRADLEKEHQAEVELLWTESTANWEQQVKDRQAVIESHYRAMEDMAPSGYWDKWLESAEKAFSDFDQMTANVAENLSSNMGGALERMVFDSANLRDAIANMAEGMARSVINALGEMGGQWLIYQLVQKGAQSTAQASAVATMTANAQAQSVMAGLAAYASTAAIPITGPAMAPAAMAAAIAATEPLAASISALMMAGMAHDGIDKVPQTGTWLLQKGERVTTEKTSARLDRTLENIERNQGRDNNPDGGGQMIVNHWNIQALDGHSVRRLLMENSDAVAAAQARSRSNNMRGTR